MSIIFKIYFFKEILKLQFKNIKNKLEKISWDTQAKLATGALMVTSAIAETPLGRAFADSNIEIKAPEVDKSGKVKFKGNGDGDPTKFVGKLQESGQFWIGVIVSLAGLAIIGFGSWQAFKASKAKMEGNPDAWKQVSNIVTGAIIGGLLMAVIGTVLAVGAATGNKMF